MKIRPSLVAALMAFTLCACGSTPQPIDRLERARAAVQAATADPAVQRYAQPELDSAQDAFASAELSARRKLDPQVTEHWAYLAEQRAGIARETGRLRRAEAEIQSAEAERKRPIDSAGLPPSASGTAESTAAAGAPALTLRDDEFGSDGTTLKPEAVAEIDQVVRVLQSDPTRRARIDGHSEDMSSRSRSIEFSGRRAEAVRGELERRGIDPRRIEVRALGDSFPTASNETSLGRQRNRRVEIFLVGGGAARP
jgi:outer membrane protein OmpA-like peptidoglycan-associated protein